MKGGSALTHILAAILQRFNIDYMIHLLNAEGLNVERPNTE
jgi:hypothetical protein